MKKFLLTVGAAVVLAVPAFAADMPRPVTKAPIAPPPGYNWTGCYIGGFVGGAWAQRDWQSTDLGSIGQGGTFALYNGVGTNPWTYELDSSVTGGGTLGCNWQAPGSVFVWGIEGEGGYMRLSGLGLEPNSVDVIGSAHIGDWYGVVAGRLGIAVNRALFYAKAGVAFYEARANVDDSGNTAVGFTDTVHASGSKTQTTWAAGGGIEYALAGNWTIKGEYLFIARGDSFRACGIDVNASENFCWSQRPADIHTAKFGINYRFGGRY